MVANEQPESNRSSHPHPLHRWMIRLGAMALVTLAALAWASYTRQIAPESPHQGLSPDEVASFRVNPYWIGFAFQLTVVPVTLLYLFSNLPPFQRIIGRRFHQRDRLWLVLGLVVIQGMVEGYGLWLSHLVGEPPPHRFTCLAAVVGGLVGGWPVGLGLGLATMLLRGSRDLILALAPEILFSLRTDGPTALLQMPWATWLSYFYSTMWGWSAVWVGVVSGLWSDLLPGRRFASLTALALGVGIELGLSLFRVLAGDSTALVPMLLVPNVVMSGVGMVVIALGVRTVQANAARRQAAVAELARTHAELRALRAQINPHFLFNALNTIRYFVRTDPETARRLLLSLSEIFQRALRSGEFVPLRDELSYVGAYLSLEKARLGERLRVVWSIQGEEGEPHNSPLLDLPVPTLILQPVVENAVIHGVARKPEGGTVRIAIERGGDDLVLRVEDDGPGIPADRLATILDPEEAEGGPEMTTGDRSIGLRNIDRRLRTLYGEAHRLRIESEVGRGTRVWIRIPIQRREDDAHSHRR
ncbi:MAG: hypothetical protein D6759_15410 [Chloroflexi bacterium]|nr:MAG: hypothetical protein D6759_15410 [Chloroflexota bacterium]